MPSRYIVRDFEENSYFHVFNRGFEKKEIFLDNKDRRIFLYYIFVYLNSIDKILEKYPNHPIRLQVKNLAGGIKLVSYCLMPNHFHLLLWQKEKDAISRLMKQLINAYTAYFNKEYKRTGTLFHGRFKSVRIKTDELLVHVSRYIHLNPVIAELVSSPLEYEWSSFKNYMGKDNQMDCCKEIILSNFRSAKDYEEFVLDQVKYAKELAIIKDLIIEN